LRSYQARNFVIQWWGTRHDDKMEANPVLGTRLFRDDKLDMIE